MPPPLFPTPLLILWTNQLFCFSYNRSGLTTHSSSCVCSRWNDGVTGYLQRPCGMDAGSVGMVPDANISVTWLTAHFYYASNAGCALLRVVTSRPIKMALHGFDGFLYFLPVLFFVCASNAASNITCPKTIPCTCKHAVSSEGKEEKVIDCSNRGLTQVPNFLALTGQKFDALFLNKNKITSLPSLAFAGLDVNRIEVSDTYLRSLSNNAFKRVKGLKVLKIENGHLSSVPVAFSELRQLREIHLKNNKIQRIPSPSLANMVNLEYLDLSHNRAEFTRPFDSFRNLRKLKYVNLGNNDLYNYPEEGLRQSVNITNLILRHNKISSIPMEFLQNMTKLTELDLEGNPLTFTNPKDPIMSGLPLLERLALGGCTLPAITSHTFDVVRQLRNLTIRECKVQRVPKGSFKVLRHLKFLDVSGNPFPVTRDVFHGIEGRLDTLKLEKMNLSEVPHRILNRFPRLKDIYLSGNNIVNLPGRIFAGFHQHNTRVYLNDNKIRHISKHLMDGAKRPMGLFLARNRIENLGFINQYPCRYDKVVVEVTGNPIRCDCDTHRMLEQKIMDLRGSCQSPPEYAGLKLMWNPGKRPELDYFENNVNATVDCSPVTQRLDQRFECTCQVWLDFESPRVCAVVGGGSQSGMATGCLLLPLFLGFTKVIQATPLFDHWTAEY